MFVLVIYKLIIVKGVYDFKYIFCVILDCVWVNDYKNNFILINIIGVILYYVMDLCSFGYGLYIVNSENELIYIDKYFKINKLLRDMKLFILFVEIKGFERLLWCVYWFLLIGDFLVGMFDLFGEIGKVI